MGNKICKSKILDTILRVKSNDIPELIDTKIIRKLIKEGNDINYISGEKSRDNGDYLIFKRSKDEDLKLEVIGILANLKVASVF